MAQDISPYQILTENLGVEYPGLQMKTGEFNVPVVASSDTDITGQNTGVAKFPTALLFWQIYPKAPTNSWQFHLRGSTMYQGASNLTMDLHIVNSYGGSQNILMHWVAWGY